MAKKYVLKKLIKLAKYICNQIFVRQGGIFFLSFSVIPLESSGNLAQVLLTIPFEGQKLQHKVYVSPALEMNMDLS